MSSRRHPPRTAALFVLLSAIAGAPGVRPAAAQTVPTGFVDEPVVSGLTSPTSFAFVPDGRIFIAEKTGIVRVVKNGALLGTPLIDLRSRVNDYWDRGMLGIAVDPAFASNGFVYLLYVRENNAADYSGQKTSRLTRVTVTGDVASLSSEVVLLGGQGGATCKTLPAGADCIPSENPSHAPGAIRFASDGTMFLTTGDGASFNVVDPDALRVQDLDSLAGKVLHVTTAGLGVATNPFWNGTASANRSKVWASGLRNPYRFGLRPGSNTPYVGDVGWNTWEEINVALPGRNFGWPCYEGNPQQAGYAALSACQALYAQGANAVTGALVPYNHNGAGAAATGGAFYTGTVFPAEYQGAYFYGDYAQGVLRVISVDANHALVGAVRSFATGVPGPVDIQTDGAALWYLSITTGRLRRVRYVAGGGPDTTPPTVTAATPAAGASGVPVDTVVTATFSEPMAAASLGTSTVRLLPAGSTTPVPATVTYDAASRTVTLDPTASLQVSTTYTATIVGGPSGAKDVAGNPLAANYTWSFATAATSAPTVRYLSDLTWTSSVNAWGPAERDRSNGEDAAGDGLPLTLNGITYAKGIGAHAASDIRVALDGACTTFQAAVGVDDEVGASGSLVFQVYGDATLLFDSGLMIGTSATRMVNVDLAGRAQLRLVVTDSGNGFSFDHADWADARLVCGGAANAAPQVTIATPVPTQTFKVGDVIAFSGSATDPEDGTIPAAQLSWDVVIWHCPGGTCHTHLLQHSTGGSGTLTAPDHGDDSYLVLTLTATDSQGLSNATTVTIHPQTIQITLATIPSGLQVTLGGTARTSPATFVASVGSLQTISVLSPQGAYTFQAWSDGGAQQHNITAGTADVTYTATFSSSGGGADGYVSDLSWTSSSNGWGPVERDRSNGEDAAGDGLPLTLAGTVYAKGLGVHAPAEVRLPLGSGCTTFTASVGVDDEVGNSGSVTFEVWADGARLYDSGAMTGATATRAVSVDVTGRADLRLVVTDGGNGFNFDHADWADARLTCASGPDTTPPSVSARTPAAGATNVAVTTTMTATFSEAMAPASLTTTTVQLTPQSGTPVAATVAYDAPSRTVTLQPTTNLAPATVHTALVRGGTGGVTDAAGNPLAGDSTWTFTTGSASTPTTTFLSDLAWTSATNAWGPVERDRSNGESAAGDGLPLTLNGVVYAKGLGVHAASDVRYALAGKCSTLTASVGLDDEVGTAGSVVFQVYGDSTLLYSSGAMTGATATRTVNVTLTGRNQLRLVVTDGGNGFNFDHADWADARITCSP